MIYLLENLGIMVWETVNTASPRRMTNFALSPGNEVSKTKSISLPDWMEKSPIFTSRSPFINLGDVIVTPGKIPVTIISPSFFSN